MQRQVKQRECLVLSKHNEDFRPIVNVKSDRRQTGSSLSTSLIKGMSGGEKCQEHLFNVVIFDQHEATHPAEGNSNCM